MDSLSEGIILNKQEILKNHKLGNFLKNSILKLNSEFFIINKSKTYTDNLKFTIVTIIYDSKNDDLFFKSLNSFFNQSLLNIEVIIINNGAKKEFLKELDKYLHNKNNVTLVNNPIPEFHNTHSEVFCPILGLMNLGLLIAKGELFCMVSWDDEVNSSYCSSIYKKYLETGCFCFAPLLKTIDLNSNIIESITEKIAKSYLNLPEVINSKEVMESRIYKNKDIILASPGESLAYQKEFLISREGFDFDVDYSQYFRIAAGERIAIIKEAILFWRYHNNQFNKKEALSFNSYQIKRLKEIYELSNIYQLHLNKYGEKWAKKIKNFYKITRIVDLVSRHIVVHIEKKIFSLDFFVELIKELNLYLIILIIKNILRVYFSRFIYFTKYLIKHPHKLLK